ncbi:MAG: hypothetical protein COB20_01460 [SAR86 cluster bacterium]|uniref:PilZ domain-containing protein n=1 Tax=SAR86 cluster bacterium TaxID=2030880 RepID=A0A2A4XHU4_9GAMM|nr:MAG: hypothetical protein COB20_01460 [SAR86 cluster bacterium]
MSALPNEEIVTNEAVILECLNQITKNNTPLSLRLRESESNDVYQSRIQSLNIKKRQIVLKQILPSDWRGKITSVTKLEIKSTMNMGSIRFYGLLSPLDDSENNPYCKLTLPKKVFRMQLRDYYRVSLAKIRSSVTLKNSDNSVIQGSCRDISMSGAMITLPITTTEVEVGRTIDECKISIDDVLELEFRGKVRSLHKTDSDTLAGIQFVDLSPSQLKPISTALNKIERQNMKP